MTRKPSAVFLRKTSSELTRNSAGNWMACLRPFLNTFAAIMVDICRMVQASAVDHAADFEKAACRKVAQIFNLLYRRFGTCTGPRISLSRPSIPPGAD